MSLPVLAAVVAAVAFAGWGALLAALTLATRSPSPRPGPPTTEPGPEPPAVVDLVTGDWQVCEEAAAATLLDLAARRVVAIEEVGPELSLVRLGRRDPGELAPYEQLVLDHVRRLARDGVVATGALAEGARNVGSWWRAFAGAVIAEARARGLSQRRWTPAHRTVLTVAAAFPAVATGLAVLGLPRVDGHLPTGLVVGGVLFAALVSIAEKRNGERGTDAGVAVAGRWLGVREHLAAGRFDELPAAAVTVRGRALAYAAALGLARRSVVSLPIASAADDRRAWSDHGGLWHLVEVRYRGRLGFLLRGRTAIGAVGIAVVLGFVGFAVGFAATVAGRVLLDLPLPDPTATARVVALVAAAGPVLLAVADLASRTTVEGLVVRRRRYRSSSNDKQPRYRYWVAIDEGRSTRLRAFGVDATRWQQLAEGDVVRARVGRRLGRIHDVTVLAPSRFRPAPPPRPAPPTGGPAPWLGGSEHGEPV